MIPVRTNAGPPTVVALFAKLSDTHPLTRHGWCAGCDLPLGQTNVALVYIGPGFTGPVPAGQDHAGAAVAVHALCAGVPADPDTFVAETQSDAEPRTGLSADPEDQP